MKRRKKIIFLISIIFILLLASAISIVFNPLGLGPEPDIVLSRDFFNEPAKDLSELELLIDGEAAFGKVLSAIDATRNSIYIQTYIWKDDQIGRHMVKKLKAAADRGVVVTIRKDVLETVFELGDMLNGKPSPVFTSAGLKGHKNINVDNDIFADTDHSKYFIVDRQVVIFEGVPDRRRHRRGRISQFDTAKHAYQQRIDRICPRCQKDDPFISELRSQFPADISKCERVLAPFKLSFSEKIMAVAGTYVW